MRIIVRNSTSLMESRFISVSVLREIALLRVMPKHKVAPIYKHVSLKSIHTNYPSIKIFEKLIVNR